MATRRTRSRSELIRLGLGSLVELSGARPQSDIIRMVQSAAVMAAPCIVGEDGNRDGMPTVLLEAMALGTPCVSTPVTGIPEIVREGETGLLVPQRGSRGAGARPQAVAGRRQASHSVGLPGSAFNRGGVRHRAERAAATGTLQRLCS
jgi:glycosyltransferase involved in cell wall biosynthesis